MVSQKFYKNKRVLVTGGAGFLGSHLAEKLISLGAQVTIFDSLYRKKESWRNLEELWNQNLIFNFVKGDVLNQELVSRVVNEADFVFHLAALPSHRLAMKEPRNYAEVDIMGTVNILEAARLMKNPPKILFSSSNKVYGKQTPPFKEDMSLQPEGPYGQAKADAEKWCYQYSKYYNIPVVVVRYHHAVGPRSQPDLALSIFVESVINGESPIIHGKIDGKKFTSSAASFTNVYDTIEGTLLAMQKVNSFDILNIGASQESTVQEMAETVIKILKSNIQIKKKQMYNHESLHHAADPAKAKQVLGWEATTPMEVSVKQYIEWRLKTGKRIAAKYKEG